MKRLNRKNVLGYSTLIAGAFIIICLAMFVFRDKKWSFLTVSLLLLSCIPFFLHFEQKETSTRRIVVVAVMTALSVTGRFLFAVIPGFKPVTAIVVITGMYLGYDAGFLCGAFSAVISNFYFGQGPWTPFQMVAWGMLGLLAGAISKGLKKNKGCLMVYAVFAGIAYSFFMDIWTVLWYNESFDWKLYGAALISAIPYTVSYAISNVVFLWVLEGPIGRKLERMKTKYGI